MAMVSLITICIFITIAWVIEAGSKQSLFSSRLLKKSSHPIVSSGIRGGGSALPTVLSVKMFYFPGNICFNMKGDKRHRPI